MHVITIFEQINLNKSLFRNSDVVKYMKKLRILTPDKYLSFRLDLLLRKWQKANRMWEHRMRPMSQSVFEAVTTNDEEFFNICSIELLMERLEKAVDHNFKVSWLHVAANIFDWTVFLLLSTAGARYVNRIECDYHVRGTTNRWTEFDWTENDWLYTPASMSNNQCLSSRTIRITGIQMESNSKHVIFLCNERSFLYINSSFLYNFDLQIVWVNTTRK